MFPIHFDGNLRKLLEKLARNKILKRKLPAEFGGHPLFLSPDSQLKYLDPRLRGFDQRMLDLARDEVRDGDVIWDVGANVGVFAFACAGSRKNIKVCAFEPDIWLAALMRRSLSCPQNRVLDISVFPIGISDRTGVETLEISSRGRAMNQIASAYRSSRSLDFRERYSVLIMSLDELVDYLPRPNLLKVDVEGAETLVMKGASKILKEVRPRIVIEVSKDHTHAVSEILSNSNYEIFDATVSSGERQRLPNCPYNTIALPM